MLDSKGTMQMEREREREGPQTPTKWTASISHGMNHVDISPDEDHTTVLDTGFLSRETTTNHGLRHLGLQSSEQQDCHGCDGEGERTIAYMRMTMDAEVESGAKYEEWTQRQKEGMIVGGRGKERKRGREEEKKRGGAKGAMNRRQKDKRTSPTQ